MLTRLLFYWIFYKLYVIITLIGLKYSLSFYVAYYNNRAGCRTVKIQASAENYLETILVLSRENNKVRSIDVAGALDYTKASVSVAMKNLRLSGHIAMSTDGYITLTESGLKIAETMYERHVEISDFLIRLGVDAETALDDACKIEHVISEKSYTAIKKHAAGLNP